MGRFTAALPTSALPIKPEEPERPPVDCEALRRGLDEVNDEIEAIRAEESAVRKDIRDLEDEISQLRDEQSSDSFSLIDRAPERAVRIGGRLLPIISGILAAQGAIDTFTRSQALAVANQKLAVLTAKLEEILDRERRKLQLRRTFEQRYDRFCRGGKGPSNPDP